ncbi:unnamed protein product [Heligmosomoides polygyrus]|uniref:Apolipoprotein L3-like n=1 Tax=Heligmosomoides polygyrus TaxID=6339 RepID=A0A3P7YY23_HELPZ|nr:unnamed protein product [Heligmosomoides polygyrus]
MMEDDFNPCKENLKRWKRNAEAAESKLIEIAAEIEKWEENTSVVNVIGTVGAFGVASSAVGLIVAPPVTFVGLAIGGIGSITTLVINALKQDNIKAPIDKGIVEVTTKNLKAVAMTIKVKVPIQMKLKIHKLGEVSKIFAKCGNKLVKALEDRSSRRQQTRSAVVPVS